MRWTRLGLGALGLAAMAFAVHGALTDNGEHLRGHVFFLALVVLSHELVVLPVAIAIGWLVARHLPGWARAGIQVGLFVSAVVTAVAFPFVLGAGRLPDNPSKFPRNYGHGLLIVLGVVWLGVVFWLGIARWRQSRGRAETAAGAP
jgi:hypothetical protein